MLDISSILGDEPTYFYKFLDCEGAKKTIENGLKFSLPNATNDPFEFRFGAYSETEAWLRGELKEKLSQKASPLIYQVDNIDSYVQSIPYEQLLSWLELKENAKKLQDKISRYYGFCSFSTKKDNLLMWAHYAQNFSGVVFCFTKYAFQNLKPRKVKYSEKRVSFPYNLNIPEEQLREKCLELLSTKSKDWEYEDEWRIVSELEKLNKLNNIYMLPIEKRGLAEVIFGPAISDKNYFKIKTEVKKRFPRTCFYRAVYDKIEYKLHFERIIN